jgi:hypothetical protein
MEWDDIPWDNARDVDWRKAWTNVDMKRLPGPLRALAPSVTDDMLERFQKNPAMADLFAAIGESFVTAKVDLQELKKLLAVREMSMDEKYGVNRGNEEL